MVIFFWFLETGSHVSLTLPSKYVAKNSDLLIFLLLSARTADMHQTYLP